MGSLVAASARATSSMVEKSDRSKSGAVVLRGEVMVMGGYEAAMSAMAARMAASCWFNSP